MKQWALAAALCALAVPAAHALDVATFVRKDQFESIRLSPTGEYLAMTVPMQDKTVLAIMRRADKKIVGTFVPQAGEHVFEFWWVSPTRVLLNMGEKYAGYDKPVLTGELYAVDADGKGGKLLVGYRAGGGNAGRLQIHGENVDADMVDTLPDDPLNVIVTISPWLLEGAHSIPYATAEKLDVSSGRHSPITKAPVRGASYYSDLKGEVRLALGADDFGKEELYARDNDGAAWKLIHEQQSTTQNEVPLGFAADNRTAYLQVTNDQGPDSIVALDTQTGERHEVFRDKVMDPAWTIRDPATRAVVGVGLAGGKPRTAFFDEANPIAKLYHSLEGAFAGQVVRIESATADGNQVLVETTSDRNPGDFYLFDRTAKKADYVISRKQELDPALLGERVAIDVKARDGMALHGFVTYPAGAARTGLPMVVFPHGGPFNRGNYWEYDRDAQMLAAHGYAVLQLNFRGSGGYGKHYVVSGYQEWGKAMQDDLTDATRWAIQQGIADPKRICIYGASYGGYAALMGVAKEQDLYRCAVGEVGVYDLPMLHDADLTATRNFLKESLGNDGLDQVSPVHLAGKIKVPVFLAAAGGDKIAPIEHSQRMEQAIRSAGGNVETLFYPKEGHGFFEEAHELEFYNKLLAFLARNIGGRAPGAAAAATATTN